MELSDNADLTLKTLSKAHVSLKEKVSVKEQTIIKNTLGKEKYVCVEKLNMTVKILTVNPFLFSHILIQKPR